MRLGAFVTYELRTNPPQPSPLRRGEGESFSVEGASEAVDIARFMESLAVLLARIEALNGLHHLNLQVAIRLAAARTHLKPVVDLSLHLSHCFVSRGSGHSDGADILAGVFDRPEVVVL
jgi:hypothetical protein